MIYQLRYLPNHCNDNYNEIVISNNINNSNSNNNGSNTEIEIMIITMILLIIISMIITTENINDSNIDLMIP